MYTRSQKRRILREWGTTITLCKRKQEEMNKFFELFTENEKAMYDIRRTYELPSGNVGDPTASAVVHMERLSREYANLTHAIEESIREVTRRKRIVDQAVEQLPPMHRIVLEERYLFRRSWPEIGYKMYFSEAYVRYIERAAVDRLDPRLTEAGRDE